MTRRTARQRRDGLAVLAIAVLAVAAALLAARGARALEAAPDAVPTGWQPRSVAQAWGDGWKDLPDWSGVWQLEGPLLFTGAAGAVLPEAASVTPVIVRGVAYDDGLAPGSHVTGAPYKPEFQQRYDARVQQARASGRFDDPIENCYLPHGMPRLMGAGPGYLEFHVTPQRTWIIWDRMNQTRRIRTNGAGHPEDEEWPRFMGDSTGHWEGQTLVVDTVWMKEGIYDRSGAPHSDQLHLTERITRTAADTITVEMTLEDPVMFTKPWQVTRRFRRVADPQPSVRGTYCDVGDTQPIQLKDVE